MENSLHHLLMTNHTAFRKRIFSALKNEGLTSGQPKVLEYLVDFLTRASTSASAAASFSSGVGLVGSSFFASAT